MESQATAPPLRVLLTGGYGSIGVWIVPTEPSATPADLARENAPQTAPGDEAAKSV